jgi:hypothetical protein
LPVAGIDLDMQGRVLALPAFQRDPRRFGEDGILIRWQDRIDMKLRHENSPFQDYTINSQKMH